METIYCDKPDRDEPRIVCGYPLPCPFHTVVIDGLKVTEPAHMKLSKKTRKKLKKIAKALKA